MHMLLVYIYMYRVAINVLGPIRSTQMVNQPLTVMKMMMRLNKCFTMTKTPITLCRWRKARREEEEGETTMESLTFLRSLFIRPSTPLSIA